MAHQHYRSPFGDTTYTKVFVGGLAWETPSEVMHNYFDQFGEILEAVIITDKHTGKSKGYGFVTFRDHESAKRACIEPNPVIDGRRANCNIASLGRPRPSPPRGRTNIYQGGGGGGTAYQPLPRPQPLPPPASPVIYPPYGYTAYPTDYGYHQSMYNPHVQQAQYYNQLYQGGSSSTMGAPYYYVQAGGRPGTFSLPHSPQQRFQGPTASYLYYPAPAPSPTLTPTAVDSGSSVYPPPPPPPQALPLSQPTTRISTESSSLGPPPSSLPISTQTQAVVAAASSAAPTASTSSSTT